MRAIGTLLLSFIAFAACSSTNSADDGRDPPPGNGGKKCYNVALNDQDGSSACAHTTCQPGRWCLDIQCLEGCIDTSNCARGSYCDLSNPSRIAERNVGTCRTPTSAQEIPCPRSDGGSNATCGDVHGAYSVVLDAAGSNSACSEFPSSVECTLAQNDCSLTFTCNPNPGFRSATLDSNDRATFSATGPRGVTGACRAQFSVGSRPKSFQWDCTFTGQGGSAVCKGDGVGR
ncbi:hypothetical protein [Pendulispora albinea]|uniref:Lipoprotein n=1 Tax=Pendulispora albinea TaxID=2741071 RepID=A0ABZ2MB68_9BACT